MTDELSVREDAGGQPTEAQKPPNAKKNYRSARPRRDSGGLIPANLTREEAVRRLEAFYELTRLVAESNNNVERIVQAVTRLVSEIIGDMTVITLLSGDKETYRIAGYYDLDPHVMELYAAILAESTPSYGRNQGWVARVLNTGEPLLIPGISAEEAARGAATPAFMDFVRQVGIASMVVVPIAGRSGILGTLTALRHAGGNPYAERDEFFLAEIAYRVALAIENATLVESMRSEIAARLFAREALVASEQRFLSIFHSTTLGIKLLDLVGTILETNPAFQSMTGYGEDQLIALHFYDLVHPDDFAHVVDAFNQVKISQHPYVRLEHRLVRRDSSVIWVRTTFAGARKRPNDDTLALIFGAVEDITDQKQADAELRELKQHLQHSIEMERLRIAQNLHDTPLQELYAVIYKLEDLRPKLQPPNASVLEDAIEDIKKTLNSLRTTASELRPPALSRFGFEKAVRSYAQDFRERHPEMELHLTLAHDRQMLPEDVRLVLFRVFQEAMNNAFRHAHATQIEVRFSFDAEQARLEVCDNGQGFKVPDNLMNQVRSGHYGLAGMFERVQAAGGELSLESSPGYSTTVRAVLPLANGT